ncbi:hypothetical protein BDW42DRAFT_165577 [Aspergillus taichungensis]|uniref:Uncharacterized protein n=1 Tax=Aspergillus taichungensis TaxID=482145 RepID=A0A2J5HZS7_9EURO|nr:hypothetical protein BDW42DRAFT_165577 [Aspergillus taichungensis]
MSMLDRPDPLSAGGQALIPNPSLKSTGPTVFTDDFSDDTESDYIQDSLSKRRRHGVYFHRPPVWWTASPSGTVSPAFDDGIEDPRLHGVYTSTSLNRDGAFDIFEEPRSFSPQSWEQHLPWNLAAASANALARSRSLSWESDQDIPLLKGWRPYGTRDRHPPVSEHLRMGTSDRALYRTWSCRDPPRSILRQTAPKLCTRLRSYKDVRLELGERWAIQEGSLVMCLDPSYTLLDRRETLADEFHMTAGDIYVVCRLYADLWALCAKVCLNLPEKCATEGMGRNTTSLGFLPLCAVTLAANFSGFARRCYRLYSDDPSQPVHPGNGLPVMPPPRSHSINASKQIFQSTKPGVSLPNMSLGSLSNPFLEADMEFVPLDSTLEHVMARFTEKGERLRRLKNRMSGHKLWNVPKPPDTWRVDLDKDGYFSRLRHRRSNSQTSDHGRRLYLGKHRRSSSSTSERVKSFIGIG